MALKHLTDLPAYNNLFSKCFDNNKSYDRDEDNEYQEMSLVRNRKNYEYILNNTSTINIFKIDVTNILLLMKDIFDKYDCCFLYEDEDSYLPVDCIPEIMNYVDDHENYKFLAYFIRDYFVLVIVDKDDNKKIIKKFINYHSYGAIQYFGGIEEFLFDFGEFIYDLIEDIEILKECKRKLQKYNEKIYCDEICKKYLCEDLINDVSVFL